MRGECEEKSCSPQLAHFRTTDSGCNRNSIIQQQAPELTTPCISPPRLYYLNDCAHSEGQGRSGDRSRPRRRQAPGAGIRLRRRARRPAGAEQGGTRPGAPGDRACRRGGVAHPCRRHRFRADVRGRGPYAGELRRRTRPRGGRRHPGADRAAGGKPAQGLGRGDPHQPAGRDVQLPGRAASDDRPAVGEDHRAERGGRRRAPAELLRLRGRPKRRWRGWSRRWPRRCATTTCR